jgi:hypothetical protein
MVRAREEHREVTQAAVVDHQHSGHRAGVMTANMAWRFVVVGVCQDLQVRGAVDHRHPM